MARFARRFAQNTSPSSPKQHKSANGLGGRRDWPHIAYVTRTHGERLHAKFQPPAMTGLAVRKGHPTVQNKGNANIYVDFLVPQNTPDGLGGRPYMA